MLSRAELSPGTEPTSQGAFEKKHAGRPWRLSRGSRHCEAQAVAAVRVQSLAWNFHLPLVQPKEKKKRQYHLHTFYRPQNINFFSCALVYLAS